MASLAPGDERKHARRFRIYSESSRHQETPGEPGHRKIGRSRSARGLCRGMVSRVQVSMLTKLEAEKTGVPAANRSAFAGCSERADTPLPKAVDRDQSKARTLLVPLSWRLGACRGRHAPGCRGRRGHCGRGSSAHLAVDLAVDAEGSGEHTREIVGPVRHDHLVGRRVSVSGPRSRVVVRVRERVRIGVWARVRARVRARVSCRRRQG